MNSSPPRQLFWQTFLSIVLGISTGLVILSFSHKNAAEALVKSTLPKFGLNKNNDIHIFPTLSTPMTVLVMGVDSNGRNTERISGCRSDSMLVVSLDPLAHKVGVVSIPRDSRVELAGHHGMDKINAAHAFGGAELALKTIGENFGIPIDHYVVVDTQALKDCCQLLGPVEVLVEKEMHYNDFAAHLHIDLKPGLQVLTPEQVEQYVRFRHDPRGDIGRIERQQWFFRAASKKLKDPQFLVHLPEMIRLAHDYVQTDLSFEDMARIATFAKDIKPENVVTAMLPGEPQMINGGSYWVPDIEAGKIVFQRILGWSSGGALVEEPESATSDSNTGEGSFLKPISVALKYPKGMEAQADQLEAMLMQQGYRVRYKWLMSAADCQHDQIVQMSGRADDYATSKIRKQLPLLSDFSVILALENRPVSDFTITVSPNGNSKTALGAAIDAQTASLPQRTKLP